MIESKRSYETVRVMFTSGGNQWGYLLNQTDIFVQLLFPLSRDQNQIITIPWHRIEAIFTEDEESALWKK